MLFSRAFGATAEHPHPPNKVAPEATAVAAVWLKMRKVSHTYLFDTTHIELSMFIFPLSESGREIFTIKYDFSCLLTRARKEFFKSIPALKVW